jgi:hypothetical protein
MREKEGGKARTNIMKRVGTNIRFNDLVLNDLYY